MKALTLWLSLASVVCARLEKRLEHYVPIGYRVVSPLQAGYYKGNDSKVVWDPAYSQNTHQLGPGLYMTDRFADWPLKGNDLYDCAMLADTVAWYLTEKVFVPETTDDDCPKGLFHQFKLANRVAYVNARSKDDISKTVLFSGIDLLDRRERTKWQTLIPPALLTSGALTVRTQCAKRGTSEHDDLQQAYKGLGYDPVPWAGWANFHRPDPVPQLAAIPF